MIATAERSSRRAILPHWRYISAKESASGYATWVRWDGARVARQANGHWIAWDSEGRAIRAATNSDGTDYIPRSWHLAQDLPIVRPFPTAGLAKAVLDKADPA